MLCRSGIYFPLSRRNTASHRSVRIQGAPLAYARFRPGPPLSLSFLYNHVLLAEHSRRDSNNFLLNKIAFCSQNARAERGCQKQHFPVKQKTQGPDPAPCVSNRNNIHLPYVGIIQIRLPVEGLTFLSACPTSSRIRVTSPILLFRIRYRIFLF